MKKTVGIGYQDFDALRKNGLFYVDKTNFIKDWWEVRDVVTLITRPRRFGKTLTMSMLERFFSVRYSDGGQIFEGLSIWEDVECRKLQGTYPVINLSFANVKGGSYQDIRDKIYHIITNLYIDYAFLRDAEVLEEKDRRYFDRITYDMQGSDAEMALLRLSDYLYRYYGKRVIIMKWK